MHGRGRLMGSGFTIIEVLIVIAIILTLGGLVGLALFQRLEDSKVDLTRTQMNSLDSAMSQFYLDFNRLPTTEEGVSVLWDRGQLEDPELEESWSGYVEDKIETDQWDNEWTYEQLSNKTASLVSIGPDGEEETEDDIKVQISVGAYSESDEQMGGEGDFGGGMPPPPPPAGG